MQNNAAKQAVLQLIFNGTAYANVADNAASSPLTNLYGALHTAWPGRTGSQSTSEASYTNYARVAIPRTSGGFTVAADGTITLTSSRSFPASSATGNNQYCPFFSIGNASSGASQIQAMGCILKSGTAAQPVTVATSGNLFTAYAHGAVTDDRVCFFKVGNSALPTGVTEGTVYWVRAGYTSDTFTVSATQGGASITVSANGAATLMVLDTNFQVGNNYTPTLTTGTTIYTD